MRYSAAAAAAIIAAMNLGEVMASPTHGHLHRAVHEKKRDVDWQALDWNDMGINWSSAYAAGQATKAAAISETTTTTTTTAAPTTTTTTTTTTAPTTTAAATTTTTTTTTSTTTAAAASSSVANIANEIENVVEGLWRGLIGISNSRTSFGSKSASSGSAGDNYQGNVGIPYASNIIKVSSRQGYPFTNEFINTSKEIMTIVIWNKEGSDGRTLSGSALAPTNAALTFVLAPGQSQIVAFDQDSQIGWAQATDQIAVSGAFATTWGECNFNSGGSGYDVSAIMNPGGSNYDMTITSAEVQCTSSMTENYWLTATDPIGTSDGSCYVPQSTVTLTTKMGGIVG